MSSGSLPVEETAATAPVSETARTATPPGYLDPKVVMSIRSLELRAKVIVEGFRTGLNRSPQHGFSVEFSEYRDYVAGDDPRFLDWKLYARTDRACIRLFEDETNLRCYLVCDVSRSMSFESVGYTKYDYARTMAAALAWLLNRQGDAAGLTLFDDELVEVLPARYRPGQLRRLLTLMERTADGPNTLPSVALEHVAQRLHRRGMVVLFSDLLAPPEDIAAGAKLLRGAGHDVIVFQVLDPAELELSFDSALLFEDMESDLRIYADPDDVREQYVRKMAAHNEEVRQICEQLGITFRQYRTDESPGSVLPEFLAARRRTKR